MFSAYLASGATINYGTLPANGAFAGDRFEFHGFGEAQLTGANFPHFLGSTKWQNPIQELDRSR